MTSTANFNAIIERMRAHFRKHPDKQCPQCGRLESGPLIDQRGKCWACISRADHAAHLWAVSGLPDHARHIAFNQFEVVPENAAAINAAKGWAYQIGGLYLWGSQGRGKTELALCIAARRVRAGQQVLFISLPRFFAKLKESFNNATFDPRYRLSLAERVPLLVLDDLGVGHSKEFGESLLEPIFDARLGAGLPTIYTSNLAQKSADRIEGFGLLVEAIGRRCASRVIDSSRAVYVGGPDWRLRGRERAPENQKAA